MTTDDLPALDGSELVDWRALPPGQRRGWWEHLWEEAIALSERYRLALRRGWWEDAIQVEALAAFSCWLRLYDTGVETDPTGKLQLLWELERLRLLLRAGDEPFDRDQDRARFVAHLACAETGCAAQRSGGARSLPMRRLRDELAVIREQLRELGQRERVLSQAAAERDANQARRDLRELREAKHHLLSNERKLQRQLDSRPED